MKSFFKSFDFGSNSKTINQFTTFPQLKGIVSSMKQFPLNFALIFFVTNKSQFWGKIVV